MEVVALGFVQSWKNEETPLTGHVIPSSRCFQFLETISQQLSHFVHSCNHGHQLSFPFLHECIVIDNSLSNSSSIEGRGGIISPDKYFQLTQNFLSGCLVRSHNVQASNSVSVHSHIFSIALLNKHWKSSLCEMSNCPNVFIEIGVGKSLICWIEEWNQLLFLHCVSYNFPLLLCGIGGSGIVGAYLEQNDISFFCFL